MSLAPLWDVATSRSGLAGLLAAALICVSLPAAAQETAAGADPGGAASDDQVNEIAGDLYCPVCPNTPLDVCETLACSEWREQIREQIAAGMSASEIADYFVEQYGERVLAKPRRSGFTLVLWILPLVGVGFGLVALGGVLRKWRHEPDAAPIPAPEEVAVSAEMRQRIEEELRNLN